MKFVNTFGCVKDGLIRFFELWGQRWLCCRLPPSFPQKLQVHLKLQMWSTCKCDYSEVWMTSLIEHSTTASLSRFAIEWVNMKSSIWCTDQILRALGANMVLLPVAPIVSSEAASTSEITNAKYSWMWLQRSVNDNFHWAQYNRLSLSLHYMSEYEIVNTFWCINDGLVRFFELWGQRWLCCLLPPSFLQKLQVHLKL